MTIQDILRQTTQSLQGHSPTAELDARILVSYVLKKNTTQLILQRELPLSEVDIHQIHQLVNQRMVGTPIAYIIGEKEFYGSTFTITPDVLIPRPETECMIDWLVNHPEYATKTIVDIGTGSGCIAISVAKVFHTATVIGTDISPKALSIAQKNDTLILGEDYATIQWYQGDLLEALPNTTRPDIILANLPYLDQNRYTDDSIRSEPNSALYSPNKGLDHYYRLIKSFTRHLFFIPEILIVEINPEQHPYIQSMMNTVFPNNSSEILFDYTDQIRHIIFYIPKNNR